jgi:hypothetical protein
MSLVGIKTCLDKRWNQDPYKGPGAAIDDFSNNGGGRYRTRRQHPLGGLLLTSSLASVVATAEPIGNTPRGPTIDDFNNGGGRCRTRR